MNQQRPCTVSQEELLHPNERRAKRQLTLAFPDVDLHRVEELACVVAARRHTIDDAIAILKKEMEVKAMAAAATKTTTNHSSVDNTKYTDDKRSTSHAVGAVDTAGSEITTTAPRRFFQKHQQQDHGPQPNPKAPCKEQSNPQGHKTLQPSANTLSNAQPGVPSIAQAHSTQTKRGETAHQLAAGPIAESTAVVGARDSGIVQPVGPICKTFRALSLASAKVVLFTTSMTGDRRVRDHCRQIETLLYLKRIRYEPRNIADGPLLQRKHREMYTAATGSAARPPIPALFVGKHFIGDYETVQELEDDGQLMELLINKGLIFADE